MILKMNDDRYSRQIFFNGIGNDGQEKILKSNILIIGCGALGSVIANNLVRAGAGKIALEFDLSVAVKDEKICFIPEIFVFTSEKSDFIQSCHPQDK